MSALSIFSFESKTVRAVIDERGEPLFVARDVAEILGYADTKQAVRAHCKHAKSLSELGASLAHPQQDQQLTLDPQTKLIPESDVYRLTMKSTLEGAERFQDWLAEEVIPSIRKTGGYAVQAPATPQTPALPSQIGRQTILDMVEVGLLFGAPKSYAIQVAAGAATLQTGLPWDRLLTQAAAMNDVPDEDVMLEPTELGAKFAMSAVLMNRWLANQGLQVRVGDSWEPTEAGARLCIRHSWVRGKKEGYNLKWRLAEIETLMARSAMAS